MVSSTAVLGLCWVPDNATKLIRQCRACIDLSASRNALTDWIVFTATAAIQTELQLMQQYLTKAHNYRHKTSQYAAPLQGKGVLFIILFLGKGRRIILDISKYAGQTVQLEFGVVNF